MFRSVAMFVCSILLVLLSACGRSTSVESIDIANPVGVAEPDAQIGQFPNAVPQDALQPWEKSGRKQAGMNGDGEFLSGRDWFSISDSGVTENGEAARIGSGGSLNYAIYRIPLGGLQPGTLSMDVNLLKNGDEFPSEYYVAFANYSSDRWEWRGPVSDGHAIYNLGQNVANGTDYLSSVQSVFVCILTIEGSSIDVVGITVNPVDAEDLTAPGTPQNLMASRIAGGLELSWNAVNEADVAGYSIHYSDHEFVSLDSAGVSSVAHLEGSTRHLLGDLHKPTYVRVAAIDHSGNIGIASELIHATPLDGAGLEIIVETDLISGGIGSPASLSASGAEFFDFDTDGDGIFEVTGNTTGMISVDTSYTGIIRPRARGFNADGTAVALGAVSLIITGNSRPLASAVASPQSGSAPLAVTLTGLAEDAEDDASALSYAWDFNGDGFYEPDTNSLIPPVQDYNAPGIYNVKFRVSDSEGASDVDTVSVLVQPEEPPAPQAPVADLQADVTSGYAPLTVQFDASGSLDNDGEIVEYAWDWDGDGGFDTITEVPVFSHTFHEAGNPVVRLRVQDNEGLRDTETIEISVNVTGNELPVASLIADRTNGTAPYLVFLNGGDSFDPDGSIVLYEWDFDGDGNWDTYGDSAEVSNLYADCGIYVVRLRVTDDNGAQSMAILPVNFPSEWFMFRQNPRHTSRSPFQGPVSDNVVWSFQTGDSFNRASASIGPDGTIYFGSNDAVLYALNPDGSLKWNYPTSVQINSTPAIGPDGTIYFGSHDDFLYALNPDGSLKWSYQAQDSVSSCPLVCGNGIVYVGTNDDELIALDSSGNLLWSFPTGHRVVSSPAGGEDGTIYFGCNDNWLYAVWPNGTLRWKFETGDLITTSPTVAKDGTIYFGSKDGFVYALNPDGTKKWDFTRSGVPFEISSPAIGWDDRIYIGSRGGEMICINEDGSLAWAFPMGVVNIFSSPAIDVMGRIYFGSGDGKVYALNPDGSELWSYQTGSDVISSPCIAADGTLYIGSDDGKLYAFRNL
ncbi:MAG: PQQ-binding-like beta-propeller repeat protein [bacterium]